MTSNGSARMKSDGADTPVSVPSEDAYNGATLSQRFQFRPYESVGVSDTDEAELPSHVSQPFLEPRGTRDSRMYDRLGVSGMIPVLLLYAVHGILARWKAIVCIGVLGSVAAMLIFNMSRPEWREMAYYRYVPLLTQHQPQCASPARRERRVDPCAAQAPHHPPQDAPVPRPPRACRAALAAERASDARLAPPRDCG